MSQHIIYVTTGSAEEARTIGRTVVTERLAACANVLGQIESFFWWEGAVQSDAETAMILKTREALIDPLVARVKELHSYDCPCVVALPIAQGNPEFLKWIESETS